MSLILTAISDDIYTKVISQHLLARYYNTINCSTTSSVLETLANEEIDILILDADDNTYDCLELCKIIADNREYSNTAVLIIHTNASNAFRLKSLSLGVEELIAKPLDFDELISKIQLITKHKKNLYLLKSTYSGWYNRYNYQKNINNASTISFIIIVSKFKLVFDNYAEFLKNDLLDIIWVKNLEELNKNLASKEVALVIFCPELQEEAFEIFALVANSKKGDCFFIILANIFNIEHFRVALDLGFNNYITLPISNEELRIRLQKILYDRMYFCFLKISMQGGLDSSMRDKLTGLFNQRYLDNYSSFFAENSNQQKLEEIFLIFIDIDDFKKVNDNNGHAIGDIVLQNVANIIKSSIRTADIAIRYGGDEFLIITNGLSFETVKNICLRITSEFKSTKIKVNDEHTLNVTVSVGFAKKEAGFSIQEIFKNADKMLYKAKNSGKNKVVY